jgi:hypothetical protein
MNSSLLDFHQFAEELFGAEIDLRVVLGPRRAALQLPNPRQLPYCGKIAALGALLPFEDELKEGVWGPLVLHVLSALQLRRRECL